MDIEKIKILALQHLFSNEEQKYLSLLQKRKNFSVLLTQLNRQTEIIDSIKSSKNTDDQLNMFL